MHYVNSYPVRYEESFNTVLQLETTRYNTLLDIVYDSMSQLLAALKGEIVMNEMLETMANNLHMNNVPELWKKRGYPSLKPLGKLYLHNISKLFIILFRVSIHFLFKGAWMMDLNERITFMRNWCEEGIPSAFWISGFFFPQALFTGTLQNYARKHSLSVDTIEFSYQVRNFINGECKANQIP